GNGQVAASAAEDCRKRRRPMAATGMRTLRCGVTKGKRRIQLRRTLCGRAAGELRSDRRKGEWYVVAVASLCDPSRGAIRGCFGVWREADACAAQERSGFAVVTVSA